MKNLFIKSKALSATPSMLSDVRELLVRLADERDRVETAPVSKMQAMQNLDAALDCAEAEAAGKYRVSIGGFIHRNGGSGLGLTSDAQSLLDLMVVAGRERIRDLIADRIEAHYENTGAVGMTDTERQTALADIDARIVAAEVDEERIARALETDGSQIIRRPDANPGIILLNDSSLAKAVGNAA